LSNKGMTTSDFVAAISRMVRGSIEATQHKSQRGALKDLIESWYD
jgi:hypothetical protein